MLAVAALALLGCSQRLPTYRYRMTVEVVTPEGVRTGSSVIEVRTIKGGGFPGPEAGGIASSVKGEAVAVDLGSRGILFALLTSRDDLDLAAGVAPTALLPKLVDESGAPEAWGNNLKALKEVKGAAPVPRSYHPMLVRFRDIRDPKTVEELDPDNLQANFGPGVRLSSVTVEITDDEVAFSLDKILPWIHEYYSGQFDGSKTRNSTHIANNLGKVNFVRGD